MIKLTDDSGRLIPALARLLNLLWFVAGIFLGWFAHSNWQLRGEADQLVDDAKEVQAIRKEITSESEALEERIEDVKKYKPDDDCMLAPVNTLDKLRGESGEER